MQDKPVEISVLINSIFYFFSYVFIMRIDGQYRLSVLLNNRLLYQGVYNTGKGAKIAFTNMFRGKAWKEDIKAEWTHFYPPDKSWLDKQFKIVDKAG